MGREIHHHKGNVSHAVDPAQGSVELEGVEQLRLAVDERNVGQMQIAMAFAHPAARPPYLEHGGQRLRLLLAPVGHLLQQRAQTGQCGCHRGAQGGQAVVHRRTHSRRRAPNLSACSDRGSGMELRHMACQLIDLRGRHAMLVHSRSKQCILGKPPHPHSGFGARRSVLPGHQPERGGRVLCRNDDQAHQAQVQAWCRAAVDAQFFLAGCVPQRLGAEVQKIQLQWLLELVGKVTSQQHPGDMGLYALHRSLRISRRGKSLWLVLQEVHVPPGNSECSRQVGG